jgi:hypothetical protein
LSDFIRAGELKLILAEKKLHNNNILKEKDGDKL